VQQHRTNEERYRPYNRIIRAFSFESKLTELNLDLLALGRAWVLPFQIEVLAVVE